MNNKKNPRFTNGNSAIELLPSKLGFGLLDYDNLKVTSNQIKARYFFGENDCHELIIPKDASEPYTLMDIFPKIGRFSSSTNWSKLMTLHFSDVDKWEGSLFRYVQSCITKLGNIYFEDWKNADETAIKIFAEGRRLRVIIPMPIEQTEILNNRLYYLRNGNPMLDFLIPTFYHKSWMKLIETNETIECTYFHFKIKSADIYLLSLWAIDYHLIKNVPHLRMLVLDESEIRPVALKVFSDYIIPVCATLDDVKKAVPKLD